MQQSFESTNNSTVATSGQAFPFHMYQMGGMPVTATQAQPPAAEQPRQQLVLGNLPQEWTQNEVLQLMQAAGGNVSGMQMKEGFCFVDFKEDVADSVAKRADGYQLPNGTTLSARAQTPEEKRPVPTQVIQQVPQQVVYQQFQPQQQFQTETQQAQPVQAWNQTTGQWQTAAPVMQTMMPVQQGSQMAVTVPAGYSQHPTPSSSAAPSPTNASNPAAPKKNNRKKKGKKARPSVFVGGIRTDITERELRNFFGVFGKINNLTIKEGYAFLDFADDESARTAVEKCNGYVYDGKPLGVRIQDDSNRRTAQDAKKAGQNVSVVFKRLEEGHAMGQVMQQAPQAVSRPAGLPNAQPGVMAP